MSWSWIVYVSLLLFRVLVCPFLPGYVHPDEFFQGGQELWFGCPPFTPWEFESQHALRSVVPPTIMTWLPLRLYVSFPNLGWQGGASMAALTGKEILIVPRVACSLLSIFVVDASVWLLASHRQSTKGVPTPVLLLASAWPTWVLLTRPFSNALETMWLALLLLTSLRPRPERHVSVGVLCAMGLFTRFTFVFYAIPSALRYIVEILRSCSFQRTLEPFLLAAVGLSLTSLAIVYVDVSYYEADVHWTQRLTPLNALSYNSKLRNLSEHGLHPHWTHAVVNMFLLYGPLTFAFYVAVADGIYTRIRQPSKKRPSNVQGRDTTIHKVCVWTILSGLGFLSLAPHQEPRFMLPILVPLVIVSGHTVPKSPLFVACWILFNALLFAFFGCLHQAGIVPSLLASMPSLTDHQPTAIIYHRTYMPPTFAFRKLQLSSTCPQVTNVDNVYMESSCTTDPVEISSVCPSIPIIDLKGTDTLVLQRVLQEYLGCDSDGVHDNNQAHQYVRLVSPSLAVDDNRHLGDTIVFNRVWTYRPHLTTEDFPPFDGSIGSLLRSMELSAYDVSCRSE